MSRTKKSPSGAVPVAAASEKPQDAPSEPKAALSKAEAETAVKTAQRARDNATAAVDDLKARIEAGDLSIPMSAIREAIEEAEFADLRLSGAKANLAKAVEVDTREKADRLYEESRSTYAADLSELAKAVAPLPRVLVHILETAQRVKSRDRGFKARAMALVPPDQLEKDPGLRNLPPETARLFAFGEFNPGEGAAAISRLDPVPAILALCVEVLRQAPADLVVPKLRDRLRDETVTTEDKRELERLRGFVSLPQSNGQGPFFDPVAESPSEPEAVPSDREAEPALVAATSTTTRRPLFTPQGIEPHAGPLSAVEIDPGPYDPHGSPD
jgi:hypothetical protein